MFSWIARALNFSARRQSRLEPSNRPPRTQRQSRSSARATFLRTTQQELDRCRHQQVQGRVTIDIGGTSRAWNLDKVQRYMQETSRCRLRSYCHSLPHLARLESEGSQRDVDVHYATLLRQSADRIDTAEYSDGFVLAVTSLLDMDSGITNVKKYEVDDLSDVEPALSWLGPTVPAHGR